MSLEAERRDRTSVDSLARVGTMAGMEWISVTDRLPAGEQRVLVWSQSNGLHIAYLDLWRQWRDADDNPGKKISHWMPFPEPPTDRT